MTEEEIAEAKLPVAVRIDHDCQPEEVARRFLAALAELGVQAEDVTPTEDDLEPPCCIDWLDYHIYPPHCNDAVLVAEVRRLRKAVVKLRSVACAAYAMADMPGDHGLEVMNILDEIMFDSSTQALPPEVKA